MVKGSSPPAHGHTRRHPRRHKRPPCTETAQQRKRSNGQQCQEPDGKSGSRILPSQNTQHRPGKECDQESFGKRVENSLDRHLRHCLHRKPAHFASLRSLWLRSLSSRSLSFRTSIRRRRPSSSGPMPWSSRRFKTSCSWEFVKKRLTRCRISDRVASFFPTSGVYPYARPSCRCF